MYMFINDITFDHSDQWACAPLFVQEMYHSSTDTIVQQLGCNTLGY